MLFVLSTCSTWPFQKVPKVFRQNKSRSRPINLTKLFIHSRNPKKSHKLLFSSSIFNLFIIFQILHKCQKLRYTGKGQSIKWMTIKLYKIKHFKILMMSVLNYLMKIFQRWVKIDFFLLKIFLRAINFADMFLGLSGLMKSIQFCIRKVRD